ncbi:MAG: winged helix DNA-binding domain-containing protein [Propionibacteriaceae bacterium]|nr:winged helix DNA-binding domain-containing protein [Propionibacteriaceae bacterium]
MPEPQLGRARLVAQGLVTRDFKTPAKVAEAFGAHQGQDLPGVLASLALRTRGGIDDVLAAFARGEIVRGYPIRGTVFAMAARDAAWITELCVGPGLRQSVRLLASRGLVEEHRQRSEEIAREVLADGPRPRAELNEHWAAAGLSEAQGANYHLLTHLISAGVLCHGPIIDGDQHIVLCEAWLPPGSDLEGRFNGDREAAVAELLCRYLTSRGPATLRDFHWWSKLPITEIRRAFALVADRFEEVEGERFQRVGLAEEVNRAGRAASAPLLLPGFDEFILGYQDRLFAMSEAEHERLVPGNNGMFRRSVVVGGQVVGTWKRAGSPSRRRLEIEEFKPLAQRTLGVVEKLFAKFPFHGG